jgi:RNA polymerase sigma-70 factor (ECF subfamily)
VIEQCDLNGMTQKDYAVAHNLSLPAVKARLRRARIELKTILVAECKVTQDQSGVRGFQSFQPE